MSACNLLRVSMFSYGGNAPAPVRLSRCALPKCKSDTQSIFLSLQYRPPELSADISERGIVLTGGGALLTDLDIMISEQTGIPVIVADDPLTCVVKGGGIALDIIDKFDVDLLSTE